MDAETPVVKRLLRNKESDPILLIIRFKDESYSCLGKCLLCCFDRNSVYIECSIFYILLMLHTGRLQVYSSDLNRHPVQIIWTLQDYEKVSNTDLFKRAIDVLQ